MTSSATGPTSDSPTVATRPTLNCPGTVQGANLDYISDFAGELSPIAAARKFVAQGSVAGFEAVPPNAVWTLGPTDDFGQYVTTDGVLLHAMQSPVNQTWIIDSAQRCMA